MCDTPSVFNYFYLKSVKTLEVSHFFNAFSKQSVTLQVILIQDSGSRILIQDPGSRILDPGSRITDPGSSILIQDPGSWIQDPGSRILDHGS